MTEVVAILPSLLSVSTRARFFANPELAEEQEWTILKQKLLTLQPRNDLDASQEFYNTKLKKDQPILDHVQELYRLAGEMIPDVPRPKLATLVLKQLYSTLPPSFKQVLVCHLPRTPEDVAAVIQSHESLTGPLSQNRSEDIDIMGLMPPAFEATPNPPGLRNTPMESAKAQLELEALQKANPPTPIPPL
jgi:hypothetical protein